MGVQQRSLKQEMLVQDFKKEEVHKCDLSLNRVEKKGTRSNIIYSIKTSPYKYLNKGIRNEIIPVRDCVTVAPSSFPYSYSLNSSRRKREAMGMRKLPFVVAADFQN